MIRHTPIAVAAVAMFALQACSGGPAGADAAVAAPVSEAEAQEVLDDARTAWSSGDAATIDSIYAEDVTGFDFASPTRTASRAKMTALNKDFAELKIDAVTFEDTAIQPLGPEVFVASTISHMTSSTGPVPSIDVRFTGVFRKQGDGTWKIVTEHVSAVPEPQADGA